MSKKTSSWERKSKIRKGEPIECRGLTFYPILMSQYEEFMDVQGALLLRMTMFPFQYVTMPFLSALWAMDIDASRAEGKIVGFFEKVIRFLYLSLRLEYKREDLLKIMRFKGQDVRALDGIEITQDGNTVKITPQDFSSYIRPLIAEQNGLKLPDESFNPELVQAEKDIRELRMLPLNYNTDDLISSVAYLSGIDELDVDSWTVLQFENRRRAIERDKRYMLYAQAELSGMVKFKKGNPYSSWCFDPAKGLSPALRTSADVNENVKVLGSVEQAVGGGGTSK